MADKLRDNKPSRSKKAGTLFPVGRIHRVLRKGNYPCKRVLPVSSASPVYLAAVLEYLTREVIELAGNTALKYHRTKISSRHLELAIENDYDLRELSSQATIAHKGDIQNFQEQICNLSKLLSEVKIQQSGDNEILVSE